VITEYIKVYTIKRRFTKIQDCKYAIHTLWRVDGQKVRFRSEHDLLQDDSEAVDVSFLSSVDRSSCHTQQFRCCPQLIKIKLKLVRLNQTNHLIISTTA